VPPETRYTRSGDVHIAYQVAGTGPFDLVFVPGFVSHVELAWETPFMAHFLGRLASFSRRILFDKRGTGLSDRVAALPTLEERMDDVRAVMDEIGSERAALLGLSEGGPMSALFAATYPERTSALLMLGSFPRYLHHEDCPWARTQEEWGILLDDIDRSWGSGENMVLFSPSIAGDEQLTRQFGRFQRMAASPGAAAAVLRMAIETDVRHLLPAIRVPTLIIHRTGDLVCHVEGARYMAERIPGARYVELAGDDHTPWTGDSDAVLDHIQEFLTGARGVPEPDRVLATVLFTDIVGSTERAAALGDRRWREVCDSHDALVRRELARFRGREVETAGDSFLATFDGPARAIRCATAAADAVRPLGIQLRAGLHTGECEIHAGKLGGIAVHIGARVAAHAGPDEILVSSTVKDLVAGSGIRFADRGAHVLKGVPGKWRLFAVESR
jgi:pimeloyl-ACP methyl ester carboxylesterase